MVIGCHGLPTSSWYSILNEETCKFWSNACHEINTSAAPVARAVSSIRGDTVSTTTRSSGCGAAGDEAL